MGCVGLIRTKFPLSNHYCTMVAHVGRQGILVKEVKFTSHNCMPIRHLTNYNSNEQEPRLHGLLTRVQSGFQSGLAWLCKLAI